MELKEATINLLNKKEWRYIEKEGVIKIDVEGSNGTWPSFIKCLDEENKFLYYSLFPSKVPKEKASKIYEVISRINFGLKIGNFEYGKELGEIHFKTAIEFVGEECNVEAMIEKAITTNILTTDEYMGLIMESIHGEVEIDKIK